MNVSSDQALNAINTSICRYSSRVWSSYWTNGANEKANTTSVPTRTAKSPIRTTRADGGAAGGAAGGRELGSARRLGRIRIRRMGHRVSLIRLRHSAIAPRCITPQWMRCGCGNGAHRRDDISSGGAATTGPTGLPSVHFHPVIAGPCGPDATRRSRGCSPRGYPAVRPGVRSPGVLSPVYAESGPAARVAAEPVTAEATSRFGSRAEVQGRMRLISSDTPSGRAAIGGDRSPLVS